MRRRRYIARKAKRFFTSYVAHIRITYACVGNLKHGKTLIFSFGSAVTECVCMCDGAVFVGIFFGKYAFERVAIIVLFLNICDSAR